MYAGHTNPMGSMPTSASGGGDAMRGQYHPHHAHQHQHQHHHHHHHHQLPPGHSGLVSGHGHGQHGQGQHVHGHSRRSSQHERSRGERRDLIHHYSSPSLAIGGESPYGGFHSIQHSIGGFVMGTDLHTATTPTSSEWYHEQSTVQIQQALPAVNVPLPETVHKDPESDVFGEIRDERQSVGHKQPMKQPLLLEGWKASSVKCTVPKLYQPSSSTKPKPFVMATKTKTSKCLDHPRDKDGNNVLLHCVELQHHIEELNSIISTLPSQPQELAPSTLLQPTAPPKPSTFYTEPPTRQPYASEQESQEKLPTLQLDQTALHLLLRKSTAAICTHVGYEGSSSRALDTLSDVLGNFLSNFCKILRINADQLCESGSLSFQDVLDQSLHQCGLGGKAELQQYWQRNAKGYMQTLDKEVEGLMAEYKQLTDPNSGKQKSSAPSSLPLLKPGNKDQEFKLPSIWPPATPIDPPLSAGLLDEELTLDTVNLENVLPIKTPDLGGPGMEFSQFSDAAAQESEGFTPLTVDGPPRKRLRTMVLEQQLT